MPVSMKQNDDATMSFLKSFSNEPTSRLGGVSTPTANAAAYHNVQTVVLALTASDSAGVFFNWKNPEAKAIIVDRVVLDITTQSSGACTVDVGIAANGTTLNDTLIDGLSIAVAGVFDSVGNLGTNGKGARKAAVGEYVTGSRASGAAAGVVGFVYITYRVAAA